MSHLAAIKVGIILEKAKVACALLLVSVAPSKGQGYQGICHLLRHPTKYAEHGIQCCQVYVARRLTHTSNLPQGRGLRQVWQRLWRAARCASAWVHEQKHSVFVLLGMDPVCESITLPMATRAPGRRRAASCCVAAWKGVGPANNTDVEYCQPLAGGVYFVWTARGRIVTSTCWRLVCLSRNMAGITECSARAFHLFLHVPSLWARQAIVRSSDFISRGSACYECQPLPSCQTPFRRQPTRSTQAPAVVTSLV